MSNALSWQQTVYQSIDLKKLYDEFVLLPEIKSTQFRNWILRYQESQSTPCMSLPVNRRLQLIYCIMELNNPCNIQDTGRYQNRVEYIFSEFTLLLKEAEVNPPQTWSNTPFLELKLVRFNSFDRFEWTHFQVLLMIFMRRLLMAKDFDFIMYMIGKYPSQTILFEDGDYEVEEHNSDDLTSFDRRFQQALMNCANTLYENKNTINYWWSDADSNRIFGTLNFFSSFNTTNNNRESTTPPSISPPSYSSK